MVMMMGDGGGDGDDDGDGDGGGDGDDGGGDSGDGDGDGDGLKLTADASWLSTSDPPETCTRPFSVTLTMTSTSPGVSPFSNSIFTALKTPNDDRS